MTRMRWLVPSYLDVQGTIPEACCAGIAGTTGVGWRWWGSGTGQGRVVISGWGCRLGRVALRLRLGLVVEDDDFRRFWASRGVPALGDGVGSLALALTAVLMLGASAWEMGVLRAAGTTPALVLSLVAGVWVDRLRRRPVMMVADLGRAALLLIVPLAAALGALRIELLWAVALSAGVLTLLYDLAWTSFVPSLVARERLVEANEIGRASCRERVEMWE